MAGQKDKEYPAFSQFIGNAFVSGTGEGRVAIVDPASETVLAETAAAGVEDLQRAIAAAEAGFRVWRDMPAIRRSDILREAARLLRERLDDIARTLTLEEGKPVGEARTEVGHAAEVFEWFAEEGRRAYGRVIPSRSPDMRYLALRQPVGPVAAFTPWNVPAVIPARKIAGALAAGCSCIIKPAEETPATCLELARALRDAGLPEGVLAVVYGDPAMISEGLIAADEIRHVSFTGSTAVGRQLAILAARSAKPAIMELGGHAPVIVLENADIEKAIALSVRQKYRNAGQVCISPTRFLVDTTIHDRFAERFAEHARALRVGPGLDPDSEMGPLANNRRREAIEAMVADAVAKGARIAAGGRRVGNEGFFFEPTVLVDAPTSCLAMNEEPFGPIAAIVRVDGLDDAIREANRLPQALAAYAFASDADAVRRIGRDVEAGMIGINNFAINHPETPFGGLGASGYGSEGGTEGLDAYLVTKLVSES